MDEKSLYAHILNLSDPWQVKSLSLDKNSITSGGLLCCLSSLRISAKL